MATASVYEGQRVEVTAITQSTISFSKSHGSVPTVTILLEPTSLGAVANTYISSVDTTQVVVNLSSPFTGYIHMHAAS